MKANRSARDHLGMEANRSARDHLGMEANRSARDHLGMEANRSARDHLGMEAKGSARHLFTCCRAIRMTMVTIHVFNSGMEAHCDTSMRYAML